MVGDASPRFRMTRRPDGTPVLLADEVDLADHRAVEVAACTSYGVPHSEFAGWEPSDRAALIIRWIGLSPSPAR